MRLLIIIFAWALFSCNSKKHDKKFDVQKDTLKPYQKYCLNILTKATADDVGYGVSDSFQLWSEGYFDRVRSQLYITRTINGGFYSYIFWKRVSDSFLIYRETQAPMVGFVSDSLYDANGDNCDDFVVTENAMNGQCQPEFSKLFCFDSDKGEFVEVEKVSSLPNVTFQPRDKAISGEVECQKVKDIYKFKWTKGFQLDTIYYKTLNL